MSLKTVKKLLHQPDKDEGGKPTQLTKVNVWV